MTVKQRDQASKIFRAVQDWLTRGLLAANIFLMTEFYQDWKTAKSDLQVVKQEVASIKTAIEFLKARL